MSPGYVVYNTLAHLAAPLVLAAVALKGRLRGRWTERLGLIRPRPFGDGPRVWVHAVSVGEVQAALALIGAFTGKGPEPQYLVDHDHGRGPVRGPGRVGA